MAKQRASKAGKYIVIPTSTEAYEEVYAVANGRRIKFETPVTLSDEEVRSLENQREPYQTDKQINVYEIMEQHGVSQAKANQIAKEIARDRDMGGRQIKWRNKYLLRAV